MDIQIQMKNLVAIRCKIVGTLHQRGVGGGAGKSDNDLS